MLCSASCHPIYPLCSGTVPEDGRRFEVDGWCFRHEPSLDPARMQSFRMQELVYVGTSAGAQEHRDIGLERGLELLRGLGLEMTAVPANDPFFGRVGTVLARAQLDEELKIEGVTPIAVESPTAVMSANCHRQHFAEEFDIRLEDGALAHSACVAFGIDRVTIALIRLHGATTEPWPASVRDSLWP
jgi:seryl-tRNA synthetase